MIVHRLGELLLLYLRQDVLINQLVITNRILLKDAYPLFPGERQITKLLVNHIPYQHPPSNGPERFHLVVHTQVNRTSQLLRVNGLVCHDLDTLDTFLHRTLTYRFQGGVQVLEM